MSDWSRDLQEALTSGDAAFMKAMLRRVPKEALQRAVPFLEEMARSSARAARIEDALIYYDQLIDAVPGNAEWHAKRAQLHFRMDELSQAMLNANRVAELQPDRALGYHLQAQAHEGLRQRHEAIRAYRQVLHLRPDDEQSPHNAIARLEDHVWLNAWDIALGPSEPLGELQVPSGVLHGSRDNSA